MSKMFFSLLLIAGMSASDAKSQPMQIANERLCYESSLSDSFQARKQAILNSFDSRCLSSKSVRITIVAKYGHDSLPTCRVVKCNGTPSDVFYAEQAFWEVASTKSQQQELQMECAFDANSKMSNTENPPHVFKKNSGSVVMHLIPNSAYLANPTAFTTEDLNVDNNLVAVKVSKLGSPALNEYRREWARYIGSHDKASKDEILKQADYMKKKYHRLFT